MTEAHQIRVFVQGVPAPQGSKTPMITKSKKVYLKEASKKLPEWRNRVVDALTRETAVLAEHNYPWVPEDRAYQLDVTFLLPRPKSHTRKQRLNRWRYQTPDLDKLVRAICDALEISGVISNDARIARLVAEKAYASPSENTGADILLRPLAPWYSGPVIMADHQGGET